MPFPASFLIWYYTKGLLSVFSGWMNFLRYLARLFSVGDLFITFFSPWKRDVTPKTWVGFNPLRSIERLLMNVFSRFMGAVVRAAVIVFGIVSMLGSFAIGLGVLLFWIFSLPIFIFFAYQWMVRGGELWQAESVMLLLSFAGFAAALIAYARRLPESFLPRDRRELFASPWFPRVLGRLGIRKEDFRRSDWDTDTAFADRLAELNLTNEVFDEIVAHEAFAYERRMKRSRFFLWENLRKTVPIGRGWQFGYTVRVDRYAVDLSKTDYSEYSKFHLFGRQDEFRIASLVLSRPTQNSLLLVGDAGIGKKTFIHAFARKIREGDLPEFEQLRFLVFDLGSAVGDAMDRDEDVDNFIRDLFIRVASAGNVVLVIENIDAFLGGNPNHPNLAPVFSEFLALPTFRVIGTIGTGKHQELARSDEPALKFFETIHLREPEPEETLRIMLNILEPTERSGVICTWKALQSMVEMSGQYEWDIPYPEKAIDLCQETILHWQSAPDGYFVTPKTVAAFVSIKTGVPVGDLGESEKDRLLRLEEIMHARVVGQYEAVRQVAESLRRARAGFGNPKRPLGSFLFLGPTGVGKTETAKALAEAYFGGEDRMIRLDMSEFQSPDAVERLIGSSMSGVEGQLTGLAKAHPFSVLLLDEIEKAYPKALDIFLQVLDEGFVTDGFGNKINFRKSIIIATSNAGSALIADRLGSGATPEEVKKEVIADISKNGTFRMEFMNRFDGVIFFSPLAGGELVNVVTIKLAALADRIRKQKNIEVTFEDGVAQAIVERGYEPEFGARSLNRYIEDRIEDVIVNKVLTGTVNDGGRLVIALSDLQ